MKKGLKIFLIVIACILGLAVIGGGVSLVLLNLTANAEEYTMGDDVIRSVTAVVGERKVTSTSTKVGDGVQTKAMHYQSESTRQDLNAYVQYLMGDGGFILTKDMDLNEIPATVQMGKASVEEGQILLLTIDYDVFGYTITIQKGKGSLTVYDQ